MSKRNNKERYLAIKYAQMKYRVTNPKNKRYFGLEICSLQEFINKFKNDRNFLKLFPYSRKGKLNKLSPAVDRINPELGYNLENIRIISHGENSRRARFFLRRLDRQLPTGVYCRNPGRYTAKIKHNYKEIKLGIYNNIQQAEKAYLDMKKKLKR